MAAVSKSSEPRNKSSMLLLVRLSAYSSLFTTRNITRHSISIIYASAMLHVSAMGGDKVGVFILRISLLCSFGACCLLLRAKL